MEVNALLQIRLRALNLSLCFQTGPRSVMMEENKVGYLSHDRGKGIKTKETRPRFVLIHERSVPLPKDCMLVSGLHLNTLKKQRVLAKFIPLFMNKIRRHGWSG